MTVDGDQVKHLAANDAAMAATSAVTDTETIDEKLEDDGAAEAANKGDEEAGPEVKDEGAAKTRELKGERPSGPRAVFNVNVTLDSSLDIEKLQRQLELLKRFGAI